MTVLTIVLTLLCFVLMFFVDREYKLAILFVGTMFLTLVVLPFKGITAMMALTFGFILSEIPDYELHWRRLRRSVVLPYIALVAMAFILAVVTSPHLHNISNLGYYALSEVMVKQFALVYGFLALRKGRSFQPLITVSFYALILMTLIGGANYISGSSIFVDQLSGDLIDEHDYLREERFRVQATFFNPFDYGYMCVLLAILHMYGYLQRMESTSMLAVAQACCLFGVLTCNCRTILFCYLVCSLVFAVVLQRERKNKLLLVVGAVFVILLLVFSIPSVRKIMLSILSIFDASSNVQGSSLGMRLLQLGTVIYYIRDLPYLLIGRGVHFFELDLGWENGSAMAADTDLYGLEGIYLNLLLERGVLGFALYLAMIVLVFVFLFRHRHLGRKLFALGIAVLTLYLLFSFMTGELLSFTPSFYILGYVMAVQSRRERIVNKKRREPCPA